MKRPNRIPEPTMAAGFRRSFVLTTISSHRTFHLRVLAEKIMSGPDNDASEVDADSNARFGKKSYWDQRFKEEEKYDWLLEFQHVEKELVPLLKPTDRILIVGCGNSTFSRGIYDAGFRNIVNIDYSGVVIENMRKVNEECEGMTWVEMDMTNMTFEDASFDVVIDKAAMDALMVEEGDVWDPEIAVIETVHRMCTCVRRVLTNRGRHIQISFAQPHFRTKYLMGYRHSGKQVSPYESHQGRSDIYRWDLTFRTISKGAGSLDSFMYIMDATD